jgi:hypothetical protein
MKLQAISEYKHHHKFINEEEQLEVWLELHKMYPDSLPELQIAAIYIVVMPIGDTLRSTIDINCNHYEYYLPVISQAQAYYLGAYLDLKQAVRKFDMFTDILQNLPDSRFQLWLGSKDRCAKACEQDG